MARIPIIRQKTCKKLFANVSITDTQRKARDLWLEKIENKELESETTNYRWFEDIILRDLLGFPEELIRNSKDKENVEYAFKHPNGEWAVLFEAKGHEQRDLFAPQGRTKPSQETPVKQTRDNMGRFVEITHNIKYGVCTNYQNFVLMMYYPKHRLFQEFDFSETEDNDQKLKEFIGIFSYETLVINKDTSIPSLRRDSENEDKYVTEQFYQLFHETRLMIIKEFQEGENITLSNSVFYTTVFLNRILFLFFAVDTGLIDDKKLFTDRIISLLDLDQCTEDSTKIFQDIELLFRALDKGSNYISKKTEVSAFNGELFSSTPFPSNVHFLDYRGKDFFADELSISQLTRPLKLEGEYAQIFKRHEKEVSPIIRNLLIMDSYDFSSEGSSQSPDSSGNVNVTILGHILEQSIGHIDELLGRQGQNERKTKGIYYTPETLTDYICRNTIIPYLSKSNVNDVDDLILEYENDIPQLEEKLVNIKIIDPACGSGAFLIKATEILQEITEAIEKSKDPKSTPKTLDPLLITETPKIITNNIFGVDLTREAVQITKLSLFLKTATRGTKLPDLAKNIVTGNSLIDDPNVYGSALNWHERFPDIVNSGGFDVVIGNPPWEIVKPDRAEFFTPLKEMNILIAKEFPNNKKTFSQLPAQTANRLIKECLDKPEIKQRYEEYEESFHRQLKFFKDSSVYSIQGGGDRQLFKLFTERALKITKPDAMFGMVMPAGILQDLGTDEIREEIFTKHAMREFCAFVNSKPIFVGVHRQFHFSTIILEKGIPSNPIFLAKYSVTEDDLLQDFRNIGYEYTLDFVQTTSPISFAVLECSSEAEKQILDKLYNSPTLHNWGNFTAKTEFHMTKDNDLFRPTQVGPPLYCGFMIHMFMDNYLGDGKRQWLVETDAVERETKKAEKAIPIAIRRANPNITFRISANEYKLVWRATSNPTNMRTLISTVIPPNFTGNNLNCLVPIDFDRQTTTYVKPVSNTETVFVCGMFNSFVVDYVMRRKMGSTNINYFMIYELPIPRYDPKNEFHKVVLESSAKLICTTDEFADLRTEIGIKDFETDAEKRFALITRINAYAAKIYGLTIKELELVLESFDILNQPEDWANSLKLQKAILDEFSSI